MVFKKRAAAAALAVATPLFCITGSASPRLEEALSGVTAPESQTAEVVEEKVPETESEPKWTGPGFTSNEQVALDFFQELGITDRTALAVLMGNIQQESKFISNICEGGARVSYGGCRYGGYGIIQWTTSSRYYGLGRYATKIGGDPSAFKTQLKYITQEVQWRDVEHRFKTPGMPVSYYMNAAYYWLGWGIHGARTKYSYFYYDHMVLK